MQSLDDVARRLLVMTKDLDPQACWPWPGVRTDRGYGQIRCDGKARYVHVMSYTIFVGEIPEGLQIDHQCHDPKTCVGGTACPHRPCWNPRHLKPVTGLENSRRSVTAHKVACVNGHPYDAKNTGRSLGGGRYCRRCHSLRTVAAKASRRAARGPIPQATHCKHGHPYDEANTQFVGGWRRCRTCHRDGERRRRGHIPQPKAVCINGHPFDEANTYYPPAGGRQCRACKRDRMASVRTTIAKGVA